MRKLALRLTQAILFIPAVIAGVTFTCSILWIKLSNTIVVKVSGKKGN